MYLGTSLFPARQWTLSLSLSSPTIQSFFGILSTVIAAFPNDAPSPRSDNGFYASLLSQEQSKPLRTGFAREVAG